MVLSKPQSHYVQNVLRLGVGDVVRLFDGLSGEYVAKIEKIGKETVIRVQQLLRPQGEWCGPWLFFSPLKKNAMDFLIEKSVEIGVSVLCPVLTNRTIVRTVNLEKIKAHSIEAAEQSERLDVPTIHAPVALKDIFKVLPVDMPLYFCQERATASHISTVSSSGALLIGPEGGFTIEENTMLLKNPKTYPVSLGLNILRAETAALYALSHLCNTSAPFK